MEKTHNTTINKMKQHSLPTASAVLADGTIVEMVYEPEARRSAFVCFHDDTWRVEERIHTERSQVLVPYSPENNLIKHEVVIFPSEVQEYDSEAQLVGEIQSFIHRYVDISAQFEKFASYYVLFSWVYDDFNELPYLRVRADYGAGKTRFLLTVGSLCYKPIFASGASTVSPLFRIIDLFRGTLILDECDFRLSDERAEVVKILNNGNARGFPVLRSEVTPKHEFNPTAYNVFGPKIVATRGFFEDRALESRCLTEEMGGVRLRDDVPINLPAAHRKEALAIRNKLLLFRFRTLHKKQTAGALVDRAIEPRLNQIFVPLLSIIEDQTARHDLQSLARSINRELVADRGMETEAQLLEVIRHLAARADKSLSVKDITASFIERHAEDYERKITPKWIGGMLRRKLQLRTQKREGNFVIADSQKSKLRCLYEKYGLTDEKEGESTAKDSHVATEGNVILNVGDVGDVGDFDLTSESSHITDGHAVQPSLPSGLGS
jgi:hypothetical protein